VRCKKRELACDRGALIGARKPIGRVRGDISHVTQPANSHLLRVPGSLSGSTTGITLPDTIRDAIRLTHELGGQYLWVDCLCIIQDSNTIEHSLKTMAAIYASAELKIVAAASKDANYGLRGIGGPAQARIIRTPKESEFPTAGTVIRGDRNGPREVGLSKDLSFRIDCSYSINAFHGCAAVVFGGRRSQIPF